MSTLPHTRCSRGVRAGSRTHNGAIVVGSCETGVGGGARRLWLRLQVVAMGFFIEVVPHLASGGSYVGSFSSWHWSCDYYHALRLGYWGLCLFGHRFTKALGNPVRYSLTIAAVADACLSSEEPPTCNVTSSTRRDAAPTMSFRPSSMLPALMHMSPSAQLFSSLRENVSNPVRYSPIVATVADTPLSSEEPPTCNFNSSTRCDAARAMSFRPSSSLPSLTHMSPSAQLFSSLRENASNPVRGASDLQRQLVDSTRCRSRDELPPLILAALADAQVSLSADVTDGFCSHSSNLVRYSPIVATVANVLLASRSSDSTMTRAAWS
ncbi:hypothetical protein C8R44DRAFT_879362 [Mycena epipterygia]|nr:hypothetical protein C8R44DRAFT_879362 [Mycena epipterygia]